MSQLLVLLRDLAVLAGITLALFCIYETLNPEYQRPPLRRRFNVFLHRLSNVAFHATFSIAVEAIAAGERLRDRCKPLMSLFRYPPRKGAPGG